MDTDQNFKDRIQIIEKANNKIFNNKIDPKINKNIIFVYSQPKVGSTTLVSSIRISASNKFTVVHIHNESTLKVVLGVENVTINEIIKYNSYLGRNVYVIDVFRTPIERKMSVFFEEIAHFHFNNLEEDVNTYDVFKVIKRFNDIFPFLALKDNYMDEYNISIAESFDFNKKYICQKMGNITYIKLRLKDSNQWGKILSELLEKEIVIIDDYKTTNKKISDLYSKFKNTYKLPKNFFETIKNCRLLNYYYSEEERNEYINSWSQKLTDEYHHFSEDLYDSYIKICLENQKHNFIQNEHYIDNGCLCNLCSKKRLELFNKAKHGVKINEKIIHSELVNNYMRNAKNQHVSQGRHPGRGQGRHPGRGQGINQGRGPSINPGRGPSINQGKGQGINPGRGPSINQGRGQGRGQSKNPSRAPIQNKRSFKISF